VSAQLDLFAIGTCWVATCDDPATHTACWSIPGLHRDGTPNTRAGSGRVDCCLYHANYFATAWFPTYPSMTDATWIEPMSALEAVA
jgi:hypothetical protein